MGVKYGLSRKPWVFALSMPTQPPPSWPALSERLALSRALLQHSLRGSHVGVAMAAALVSLFLKCGAPANQGNNYRHSVLC